MQSVYQSNSNLGDPSAIEGQLRESVQRLQKLQQEMQKYQTYLNEMDMPQYGGSSNGSRTSQNRSSGSDESLSRSASDLSNNHNHHNHNHHHNNKPSAPGTPLPSHGSVSQFFSPYYNPTILFIKIQLSKTYTGPPIVLNQELVPLIQVCLTLILSIMMQKMVNMMIHFLCWGLLKHCTPSKVNVRMLWYSRLSLN